MLLWLLIYIFLFGFCCGVNSYIVPFFYPRLSPFASLPHRLTGQGRGAALQTLSLSIEGAVGSADE